jgi:hypothetical protein
MPDVLQLADRFKVQVAARDEKALQILIDAYQTIYKRLQGDIDALVYKMAQKPLTADQVRRLDEYTRLMGHLEEEMKRYEAFVHVSISGNTTREIGIGIADAERMIKSAAGDIYAGVGMTRVPVEVVQEILGFLDPAGPLYKRLDKLSDTVKAEVTDAILQGIGVGDNPRTTARVIASITDGVGLGLTDSMRMMRTAQLYSYREANRASYVANNDVVMGWSWYAHLATACMSCLAMHGTEHTLDETLDDHHNGECVMVPIVLGGGNMVKQSGEDWFSQQPEAVQRKRMGSTKWQAWQDEKFKFSQLSVQREDPVYGRMRSEAALKDLVQEE